MLRIKDDVDLRELEKFGFKYGTRDRIIYKTKSNGMESSIYVDLLPCRRNNELTIASTSYALPEKIANKLYDLIQAGLVERVGK